MNPLYRQAIHQTGEEQKDAMKEDLERAPLFVKCLQQRNNTMQRLMQKIGLLQRNFILHGEKYLATDHARLASQGIRRARIDHLARGGE